MGQLRDWWPSEDALGLKMTSLAHARASPPLQLSQAAASRKEEQHLPRLLGSNITITSDLAHQASDPTQEDQVLKSTSCSFGGLPQQVHSNKPSSSLSVQDEVSRGPFRGFVPQVPSAINMQEAPTSGKLQKYLHVNSESITVEATGTGGSFAFGVFHPSANKESSISEKFHSLQESMQDYPNKGKEMTRGSQEELQQSLNKKSSKSQKSQSLNDVQHHPINKESLSRREIHIFSERQRRQGMTHLYTTLLSLLPDAKPKTDRCKVLTDAIDYIHILREHVDALGCERSELMASLGEQQGDFHNVDAGSSAEGEMTNSSTIISISDEVKDEVLSSADLAVRFCGRDAFVTLNGPKKKGVWSGILQILHEHDVEVLNVTLSTGSESHHHCIHARLSSTDLQSKELEKVLQDLILSHAILG